MNITWQYQNKFTPKFKGRLFHRGDKSGIYLQVFFLLKHFQLKPKTRDELNEIIVFMLSVE